MAQWTNIDPNTLLAGDPWTSSKAQAAFENVEAVAEGAPGAPRVDPIAAMAHQGAASAVGTYVFGARGTGTADVSFGATLAGSSIVPTSAARIVGPGIGGGNAAVLGSGSALSGTWRCMGFYDHTVTSAADSSSNTQTTGGATLWLRIA